jgi:hypothetical protein
MNIYKAIKNSYYKSINGEEKLWKVFWLWGFSIYVGSIAVGIYMVFLMAKIPDNWVTKLIIIAMSAPMIPCGLTMILKFPIILISSLIKCSENAEFIDDKVKKRVVFFFKKIFPVIFSICHFFYSLFILLGIFFFMIAIFLQIKPIAEDLKIAKEVMISLDIIFKVILIGYVAHFIWSYRKKLVGKIKHLSRKSSN